MLRLKQSMLDEFRILSDKLSQVNMHGDINSAAFMNLFRNIIQNCTNE